jgi:hypothetical protein
MRHLLFICSLFACALVALPSTAGAAKKTRKYVPYYDVSVAGTISESWRIDRDLISDGCGRHTTGSGTGVMRFATPKPKRMSFNVDSGFHSKPAVDVTVDRNATISSTPDQYTDCEPAPTTAGCGTRSYKTKVELDYPGTFHPNLLKGDRDLFRSGDGQSGCPLPGSQGTPEGFGGDIGSFETTDVLSNYGPSAKEIRLKILTCMRRNCRHKRTNVIRVQRQVKVPYVGFGQQHGEYTADVSWEVKFFWVNPVGPGYSR